MAEVMLKKAGQKKSLDTAERRFGQKCGGIIGNESYYIAQTAFRPLAMAACVMLNYIFT